MSGRWSLMSDVTVRRAGTSAAVETLRLLFRHRSLLLETTRRELSEGHAGHALGAVWALLHPLILMAVYVFVFAVVFQTRVGGTHELPLDYTSYVLAGLAPWLAVQQALMKSCTAITGSANLVKQVVFPLEILPAKTVLSTMLGLVVALGVALAYMLVSHGSLLWTVLLLPLLLAFHVLAMTGVALVLASVSVFFRDVRELVQIFAFVGIFVLPVVYLPAWVPAAFKPFLYLNPLSYLIWCYQDVLYFGRIEHPLAWLVVGVGAPLTFWLGAKLFRGLKHLFGDAL